MGKHGRNIWGEKSGEDSELCVCNAVCARRFIDLFKIIGLILFGVIDIYSCRYIFFVIEQIDDVIYIRLAGFQIRQFSSSQIEEA